MYIIIYENDHNKGFQKNKIRFYSQNILLNIFHDNEYY